MANEQPQLAALKNQATTIDQVKRQGARELCDAAAMILERECMAIAEALSKSGKEGHLHSIKFLYELAKSSRESDQDEGDSGFRRRAQELAAEPEWEDQDPEEDEEIFAGTRDLESDN